MKIITVNEVAQKLRCSVSTIYRYTSKRKIPFIKRGHHVLFIEEHIDKWILSNRVYQDSINESLNLLDI